jgi:aspartate kinase
MISQTAPRDGYINVSFTTFRDDIGIVHSVVNKLKNEIKDIEIHVESNITKISVVGIGMMNQSGVAAKVFKIFADNDIEFKQVTTSEISISYTIDSREKGKAITVIAKEFDL